MLPPACACDVCGTRSDDSVVEYVGLTSFVNHADFVVRSLRARETDAPPNKSLSSVPPDTEEGNMSCSLCTSKSARNNLVVVILPTQQSVWAPTEKNQVFPPFTTKQRRGRALDLATKALKDATPPLTWECYFYGSRKPVQDVPCRSEDRPTTVTAVRTPHFRNPSVGWMGHIRFT